ncbi:MAG: hypothetical protein ACRDT0_26385 [Pseudonocardiaceae bacterium]
MPAATIVAGCRSAETGLGPSMARESQKCSGSCTDCHLGMFPAARFRQVRVETGDGQPRGGEFHAGQQTGQHREQCARAPGRTERTAGRLAPTQQRAHLIDARRQHPSGPYEIGAGRLADCGR